jgi:hypothetical protein
MKLLRAKGIEERLKRVLNDLSYIERLSRDSDFIVHEISAGAESINSACNHARRLANEERTNA